MLKYYNADDNKVSRLHCRVAKWLNASEEKMWLGIITNSKSDSKSDTCGFAGSNPAPTIYTG